MSNKLVTVCKGCGQCKIPAPVSTVFKSRMFYEGSIQIFSPGLFNGNRLTQIDSLSSFVLPATIPEIWATLSDTLLSNCVPLLK